MVISRTLTSVIFAAAAMFVGVKTKPIVSASTFKNNIMQHDTANPIVRKKARKPLIIRNTVCKVNFLI